jgi:hypothetical protein
MTIMTEGYVYDMLTLTIRLSTVIISLSYSRLSDGWGEISRQRASK